MPKNPNFENPVRDLRTLLGKTQVQFAEQLAISPSLLQKIELGERSLPVELAEELSALFGVAPNSMMEKKGKALMFNGLPVTKEFLNAWQTKLLDDRDRDTIKEQLVLQLETILDCSRELPHGKQRLVAAKLSEIFQNLLTEFKLTAKRDNYLEKKRATPIPEESISVGALNARFEHSPVWKKVASTILPFELAVVKGTRIPLWAVQGGAVILKKADGTMELAYVSSQTLCREKYEIKIRGKVHKIVRVCPEARLSRPTLRLVTPPQTEPDSTSEPV